MAEHLHGCLRCQAELAGYRHLLRVLRSLREESVPFPSPDLVGDVLRALQERVGALQDQMVARSRKATDTWLLAGAVAGLGVAILGARAARARAPRRHRATGSASYATS
jgi:hypothetical protein